MEGGEPDRALPYALLAGDQAESVWAHTEAEQHYRTALTLARQVGNVAAEAQALEKLGMSLQMLSRSDAALDTLEDAASLYCRLGDQAGEARVTAGIGSALANRGDTAAAITRLEAMRDSVTDQPSVVSARLSLALSAVLYGAGRPEDAIGAAARAERESRAVGDMSLWAQAECYRGDVLMQLGRAKEARDVLAKVIPIAETEGDLNSLTHSVHDLASVSLLLGEIQDAADYINRALALHQRRGSPEMIAAGHLLRGVVAFYRGAWKRARADYTEGLGLLRELPPSWQTVPGLVWMGQLEVAEGHWEAATRWLDEAMATGDGTHMALPTAHQALAERDLIAGRSEAARSRLESVVRGQSVFETLAVPTLAEAQLLCGEASEAECSLASLLTGPWAEIPLASVEAMRVKGMILGSRGRAAEAQATWSEAIVLAHQMPYPYSEARSLFAWGQMLLECGEVGSARERLEEALIIFRQLGAKPLAEAAAGRLASAIG
jgi:tetratricopeptide (TPR) repeat protein